MDESYLHDLRGLLDRRDAKHSIVDAKPLIQEYLELAGIPITADLFLKHYKTIDRKYDALFFQQLCEATQLAELGAAVDFSKELSAAYFESKYRELTGSPSTEKTPVGRFVAKPKRTLATVAALITSFVLFAAPMQQPTPRPVAPRTLTLEARLDQEAASFMKAGERLFQQEITYQEFAERATEYTNVNEVPFQDDYGVNPTNLEFYAWAKDASRAKKVPLARLLGILTVEIGGVEDGQPVMRPYDRWGVPRQPPDKGAYGPGQIRPNHHPGYESKRMLKDSRMAIWATADVLAKNMKCCGTVDNATKLYYGHDDPGENERYLSKVRKREQLWNRYGH